LHGQKDRFLQLFLKILQINHKLKNPQVYCEYLIKNNRRIDIVIEDVDFIIAIEAKIYAKDQENQLLDYSNFLLTEYSNTILN
jgi:hypothetical protein